MVLQLRRRLQLAAQPERLAEPERPYLLRLVVLGIALTILAVLLFGGGGR